MVSVWIDDVTHYSTVRMCGTITVWLDRKVPKATC